VGDDIEQTGTKQGPLNTRMTRNNERDFFSMTRAKEKQPRIPRIDTDKTNVGAALRRDSEARCFIAA